MNTRTRSCLVNALLTGVVALAACTADRMPEASVPAESVGTSDPAPGVGVGVDKTTDGARNDLRTRNIALSEGRQGVPTVEITPQGDLLINAIPVETTPGQQALLVDYRNRLIEVAEGSMGIDAHAVDLAGKGVGESANGPPPGMSQVEIERAMRADAAQIEAAAAQLCDRLPALLASEQRLAAALPEFAPYAHMDDGDIDDCKGRG